MGALAVLNSTPKFPSRPFILGRVSSFSSFCFSYAVVDTGAYALEVRLLFLYLYLISFISQQIRQTLFSEVHISGRFIYYCVVEKRRVARSLVLLWDGEVLGRFLYGSKGTVDGSEVRVI